MRHYESKTSTIFAQKDKLSNYLVQYQRFVILFCSFSHLMWFFLFLLLKTQINKFLCLFGDVRCPKLLNQFLCFSEESYERIIHEKIVSNHTQKEVLITVLTCIVQDTAKNYRSQLIECTNTDLEVQQKM